MIDFRYDVKKSDGDVSAHYIRMNNAIIENRNSSSNVSRRMLVAIPTGIVLGIGFSMFWIRMLIFH